MIICSLPRCGATKYCQDLESKTGLEFIGELHPMYIGENAKARVHETLFQPTFTPKEFAHYIKNNKHYIILVNQNPCIMLPFADRIIIRKNMLDAFKSQANFLLKMYPSIKANVLLNLVKQSMTDYKGLIACVDNNFYDLVYYEDYYGVSGTNTAMLDNHIHGKTIIKAIEEFYNG